MTTIRNIFFISCISIFIQACASVKPVEYAGFENFKLSDVTSNPKIQVDVKLHNPSPIGGKLKNLNMKLSIENKNVGVIDMDNAVRMKAKKDFTVPITFETSLSDAGHILSDNAGAILSGKKIPFEFSGSFTVQKFIFFRKTFEFNYKDGVNMKDIKTH